MAFGIGAHIARERMKDEQSVFDDIDVQALKEKKLKASQEAQQYKKDMMEQRKATLYQRDAMRSAKAGVAEEHQRVQAARVQTVKNIFGGISKGIGKIREHTAKVNKRAKKGIFSQSRMGGGLQL